MEYYDENLKKKCWKFEIIILFHLISVLILKTTYKAEDKKLLPLNMCA